jgi:ribosomal protein S18 acetylase RimI-like enzyme
MKKFLIAQSDVELKRCYTVMYELRPHLSESDFFKFYKLAYEADGYQMMYLQVGDDIRAVMGYRQLTDFVRGPHLYIDDLVTSEKYRSQGCGAELLKQAELVAAEKGLQVLRLCTGIDNANGIRFYEKNNWIRRTYSYVKKIV